MMAASASQPRSPDSPSSPGDLFSQIFKDPMASEIGSGPSNPRHDSFSSQQPLHSLTSFSPINAAGVSEADFTNMTDFGAPMHINPQIAFGDQGPPSATNSVFPYLQATGNMNVHDQYGQLTPPHDKKEGVGKGKAGQHQEIFQNTDNETMDDAPPETGRKRTRRTRRNTKSRKSTETVNSEEEKKREKFLERNRVAASKCRQKKREHNNKLEERAREASRKNKELHLWVSALKEELLALKSACLAHSDCGCNQIRDYLKSNLPTTSGSSCGSYEASRNNLGHGAPLPPRPSANVDRPTPRNDSVGSKPALRSIDTRTPEDMAYLLTRSMKSPQSPFAPPQYGPHSGPQSVSPFTAPQGLPPRNSRVSHSHPNSPVHQSFDGGLPLRRASQPAISPGTFLHGASEGYFQVPPGLGGHDWRLHREQPYSRPISRQSHGTNGDIWQG